jgi:hypothetical protein
MRSTSRQSTARSDEVRARRMQRETRRVEQTGVRARQASVNLPPVMARALSTSIPLQQKQSRRQKVRRRVDVALNVPGAEVHLPSLPVVNLDWRLLSAALAIGLGALLYWLWNDPLFVVSTPQIVGMQRLTEQDINAVLKVSGENIFTLQPVLLQNELQQAFPELSSVIVYADLPAQVTVAVTERTPVLEWQQDQQTLWVDKDGIAFTPRGTPTTPLPIIKSQQALTVPAPRLKTPEDKDLTNLVLEGDLVVQPFISHDMIKAVQALQSLAPAGTPIMYDQKYGFGWTDPQGWQVYFGLDMNNIKLKSLVYQAVSQYVAGLETKPILISVENPHAPFYRLE